MALLKCHECKKDVSTEAKRCPHCGAKVRRPMGLLAKIFLGFVAFSAVMIAIVPSHQTERQATPRAQPRAPVALSCGKSVAGFRDATMGFDVGGINDVKVTFLAKRPATKDMDRVLRECLAEAVKVDGSKDILSTPWFRRRANDNPADDELLRPYGPMTSLAYKAATKQISLHKTEKPAVTKSAPLTNQQKQDQNMALAVLGARSIKNAARDPESFKLREVLVMPDGAACYKFRAKNALGAELPSEAVMTPSGKLRIDSSSTDERNAFVSAFNKHCANKTGVLGDVALITRLMDR